MMRVAARTFGCCLIAMVWVLLLASPAAAQFDRGTISGVVKDQSGAIVPGATVGATSLQTQAVSTAVTDASGYFTLPMLRPGRYDVSAELQGFKKASRSGVVLDGGAAVRIELSLEPGSITESVTVVAESTPIQTEVALRKTVEAKDIELLSFSGRNPIGVPALKAGVVGGNFNNAGFAAFSNGGFNMNGSRADENTIAVDGAIAIRTRSAGTIIGVQNVDAIQEVQVLTANYLPEYGRASGGQIRFITKSGSSSYHGSASYFYRDDKLQANTWARNRSPNATENTGPAPFDYKQYGWSFGGPVPGKMFKDKLFFFAAQEWVDYFAVATNTATVPTLKMRNGDFSELLGPNQFYSTPQVIRDPLTGQPFPGNIIPANRLSPNGIALMKLYPEPTPGFRSGSNNVIMNSENPQDQRKDNFRLDYRLNNRHSFTFRYSKQNWVAVDAFRGTFPFARTDWDRPNKTMNFNWAWTISPNLINEASFAYSIDQVFINVFTETGLYKRSRTNVDYPYIYPGKEIEDKIPTINIDSFTTIDGGPYPSSSEGPIYLWTDTLTWVKGRHTLKAGVAIEYSGEDDFDQINVNSIPGGTNNQNGQFDFRNTSSGRTGLGIADMAVGIFTNYAEIGQRARTNWRALATDIFVQDSWRPNEKVTVEGGFRYALWPPWYSTTNNIANFDPRFYNKQSEAVINRSTGRLVSGPRYNGIVLPGDGFVGEGNDLTVAKDPAVQALFRGEPRGFSETHYDLIEPRAGVTYSFNRDTIVRASGGIFHNRVTLNDSTLLGGNPPFQPMVTVSNGSVDRPGGTTFANDLPFGMQGQDVEFKLPMAYMWSVGFQRKLPYNIVLDVTYVGRRGQHLQRERNINQLPAGTLQANPGVNIAALRPYKGYGALRVTENSGHSTYNSLQVSAERRYANGFKLGVAYTYGRSYDNGSDKRNVLWNSYDDTNFWGLSSYDRTHALVVSYIWDLPFWRDQSTLVRNLLGGWQISGATFIQSGQTFSITRTNDIAGVGEGSNGQPVDLVGDPNANTNGKFSAGSGLDSNFWFNPAAFANPAAGKFGNLTRDTLRNPMAQQWDIALFKNFVVRGSHKIQFRAEVFNFLNHANLSAPISDITNPNFGRVITKDGARRDIQLALRYFF
jgi:hypothetical protein